MSFGYLCDDHKIKLPHMWAYVRTLKVKHIYASFPAYLFTRLIDLGKLSRA